MSSVRHLSKTNMSSYSKSNVHSNGRIFVKPLGNEQPTQITFTLQWYSFYGVVAQWCNRLILQPEQSGGVGSKPGGAPPLERHDKGWRTRVVPSYFCDPSARR